MKTSTLVILFFLILKTSMGENALSNVLEPPPPPYGTPFFGYTNSAKHIDNRIHLMPPPPPPQPPLSNDNDDDFVECDKMFNVV
jgi:hypothetical protein